MILSSIIKSHAPSYGVVVQVGRVAVVLVGIVPEVKLLLGALESIKNAEGFSTQGLSIMLKIFSVLVVGSVCGDICRDNGENAVAGVVELSSKLTAFACALPVMTAVLSLAASFLNVS